MRIRGIAIVTLLAAAASPVAAEGPKSFDTQAADATVLSRADLAGLVWALTAPCTEGDDVVQRQCRVVRDARSKVVRATTFLVDGDQGAVSVESWAPETKSAPVVVRGCVACLEPIGGHYVVASKAAPTWQGDVAQAAILDQVARPFADEAAAAKWIAGRAGRLRNQFVVRVATATGGLWEHDGKPGVAVDVLGYRVYDPCDGEVVRASGESSKGAIDRVACGDADTAGKGMPGGATKPKKPVGPALPDQLQAEDIKGTMEPVVAAAKECFNTYGVAGVSKLTYTVSGDGSVLAYELSGDFIDTPTGKCIDKAARQVTFPKVKKKKFTFPYPLILQ